MKRYGELGGTDKKTNQDLLMEAEGMSKYTGGPDGYNGYVQGAMNNFYSANQPKGAMSQYSMMQGAKIPSAMSSGKQLYMNHFNHLNTIEEEKHETQTSNYFKEGESERDDSKFMNNNQAKGSRILGELTNEGVVIGEDYSNSTKHNPDYNFQNKKDDN